MSQQPEENNTPRREGGLPPLGPSEPSTSTVRTEQQQLLKTMQLLVNQNQQMIQLMLTQGSVAHHPAREAPLPPIEEEPLPASPQRQGAPTPCHGARRPVIPRRQGSSRVQPSHLPTHEGEGESQYGDHES